MSSSGGEEPRTTYQFKGRFGAAPSTSLPIQEASHEEVDRFIRDILGLKRSKATENLKSE